MYIKLIYSHLLENQKNKIKSFIFNNFNEIISINQLGLVDNSIIILRIDNDVISGCVCLIDNKNFIKYLEENNGDKYKYHYIENRSGVYLYNFCVDKELRGNNIGTMLLEYTIDLIKELNINYIHCYITNDISKHIFTKLNFNKSFNDNYFLDFIKPIITNINLSFN